MNFFVDENVTKHQHIYLELDMEEAVINEEVCKAIFCPRCKGKNINKNGRTELKRQRYICKNCRKSFSETTGSPLSYSKKSKDMWIKYIFCMKERLTLREVAKILNINLTTSFHWRHKILSVAGTKIIDKKLSGTIEVDELRIKENFKGNHRKKQEFHVVNRYYELDELKNGISERGIISILSCKDTEETILFKAVTKGRVKRKVLDEVLTPAIRNGKILSTTRNFMYINFAKANKLKLCMAGSYSYLIKGIDIKRAKEQSINFKRFLRKFAGVASKYMSYYINWFKINLESSKKVVQGLLSKFITGERQLRVYEFKIVQFDGTLVREDNINASLVL